MHRFLHFFVLLFLHLQKTTKTPMRYNLSNIRIALQYLCTFAHLFLVIFIFYHKNLMCPLSFVRFNMPTNYNYGCL